MPSSGSPTKTSTRPRGLSGRADLAAALAEGNFEVARAVAEIAGFDWRPDRPELNDSSEGESEGGQDTDESEQAGAPGDDLAARPLAELPFWLPFRYAPVTEHVESEGPAPSSPYVGWTRRPEEPPPIPPLSDWRELEPRLRRLLCLPQQGRAIDMELVVRQVSRGRFLAALPRERRRRWGPALHVVEDRNPRLIPFGLDQYLVVEALHRLLPEHDISHVVLRDDMRRSGVLPTVGALPSPGTIVLVLGDLGCLSVARPDLCKHWLRFGVDLRAAGCTPVALIPGPLERCPGRLSRVWHLIPWERPRPSDPDDSLAARAKRLLRLVSPAVRIEPGLLRAARLLLKPSEADAGTEADVWQHPDLVSRSAAGATLSPERAKQLRAEFAKRLDPELQARFAVLLRSWRGYLAEEIWFEELLNLPPAARAAGEMADDLDDARKYFAEFAQECEGGPASTAAADLGWFERVERRAVPLLWQDEQVGDELKRLNHRLRGQKPDYRSPPGFDPALIRRPDLPVRRLALRQHGDRLELAAAEAQSADLHAGSPLIELTSRNGLIQIEEAFWATGESPPWAEQWGWDDYGAWVSFSIENAVGARVTQAMRWVEPGDFLMGSPEAEPERYDDEGPQHSVTIDRGFWLFGTACPQALWEAVMGQNPSQFQGKDRPAENVSWHDVQRFITALNERVPGLDLGLPSEAQWEYACRAGSTTPFSFGDNVTPEQVNYHGDSPYAGGEKGRYRRETVPVGSLPPNAWGLHEMHGNVDEWVQDTWHDSYQGAPEDGRVWESNQAGAGRVVRGGSWHDGARDCRCAYRDHVGPDDRYSPLGFRCARVQVSHAGERIAEPAVPALVGQRPTTQGPPGGAPRQEDQPPSSRGSGRSDPNSPALLRLETDAAEPSVVFPRAPALLIRTDRERLTFRQTAKPGWADTIGRDRFGLWTEIAVEPRAGDPVIQRLRWIPPGRFRMGSPQDEPGRWDAEGPQHDVTLSQGYWLFDTPCTQALWEAVMGDNPSRFQTPERPVEQVSWDQVQEFLELINASVPGLELVLPSEAQWEYACRAGSETALYTGAIDILGDANAPALHPIAWYGGNSGVDFELENGEERTWLSDIQFPDGRAGTHPVKGKQPNAWGLYDMLGNVWEWLQDPWHETYEGGPEDGSVWESDASDAMRVVRGGSWNDYARYGRCAYRVAYEPGYRLDGLGFRCARVQS